MDSKIQVYYPNITNDQRYYLENISEKDREQLMSDEVEYDKDGEIIWYNKHTESGILDRLLQTGFSKPERLDGDALFILYKYRFNSNLVDLVALFKGELTSNDIIYKIRHQTLKIRYRKEFVILRQGEMLAQLEINGVNRGDPQDIEKYMQYLRNHPSLFGLKESMASNDTDLVTENRGIGMAISSLIEFSKLIFKEEFRENFVAYEYHKVIAYKLMKAYDGLTTRLLINIPPRFGKTKLAVILFISWCMGRSPSAKFIHATYSHKLARQNCEEIRRVMTSEIYQKIFPHVKLESSRADYVQTTAGGFVYATGSEGSVTGFGAGSNSLQDGFGGCLILDDPHKASEIYSTTTREKVIRNYYGTLRSRVNNQVLTPIIVIGQRLHPLDLWGTLIEKDKDIKAREGWEKVIFPVFKDGVFLENFNMDVKSIKLLESNQSYIFASQYQQKPVPQGGVLFKDEWWRWYKVDNKPNMKRYIITGDTAQKTGESNSFSVFQLWGSASDGNIYLLDSVRGKWKAPDLRRNFINFYQSSLAKTGQNMLQIHIEDKSSGTGLIQDLQIEHKLNVIPIQRSRDKVSRAYDNMPYIESGKVYLPERAIWINDYLNEFRTFSDLDKGNSENDDQVDATLDAIDILLRRKNKGLFAIEGLKL